MSLLEYFGSRVRESRHVLIQICQFPRNGVSTHTSCVTVQNLFIAIFVDKLKKQENMRKKKFN